MAFEGPCHHVAPASGSLSSPLLSSWFSAHHLFPISRHLCTQFPVPRTLPSSALYLASFCSSPRSQCVSLPWSGFPDHVSMGEKTLWCAPKYPALSILEAYPASLLPSFPQCKIHHKSQCPAQGLVFIYLPIALLVIEPRTLSMLGKLLNH